MAARMRTAGSKAVTAKKAASSGEPPSKPKRESTMTMAKGCEESGAEQAWLQVVQGKGVSLATFVLLLTVLGATAVLGKAGAPHLTRAQVAALLALLAWVAPLKELAYIADRVGAVRGELHNITPYTLDLLPTALPMLPFAGKIIDNIELVGPFIPDCMQPGVKEHMLPLMPQMMPDLELVLPHADAMRPHMAKIAPHAKNLMPYLAELAPHTPEIIGVVDVPGAMEQLTPFMGDIVPLIDRVAPFTEAMLPHMPAMLPYLPILVKHMDAMVDELEGTVGVLDRLVPLLPLLPAADMAGMLSSPMGFKVLPKVLSRSPISNDHAEIAAVQAAKLHLRLVDKLSSLQDTLIAKYQTYRPLKTTAIADEKNPAVTTS